MNKTVIDALASRNDAIVGFLREKGEVSLALDAEANFKKLLVMACGSFFEEQLTGVLEAFAGRSGEARLAAFVRNKALKRQYHSLFKWDAANVNGFLGLFGEVFAKKVTKELADSEELTRSMRSFLWLGERRNQLAHGNIAAVPIDETKDEILEKFSAAWKFVRYVAAEFGEKCPADGIVSPNEINAAGQ